MRETASGIRGSVTRAGAPVRWTRVEAKVGGTVVAHAQGDDRGEFLLVLGPIAGAIGDLVSPLAVSLTIHAPEDPLADLPVEDPTDPGVAPEDMLTGVRLPEHYAQIAELPDHPLPLGRLQSVPISV